MAQHINRLILLFWLCTAAQTGLAQDRVALVIGNSRYSLVESLENPANDARVMAKALTGAGFEVTLVLDADQATLVRAISQFGRDLRGRDADTTGLFYFAGHGVQSFGYNYLLPVDVSLTDAADLPLVGIEAQAILRQMYSARNRTNIVILDACRNNPFNALPDLGDNGLAEMKAPTGTFLAYATAPGEVALDGTGGNSPFTEAIARRIPEPGVPIELTFKSVRVDVLDETGGLQVPWDTSSLTSDFTFTPADRGEAALWARVRDSGDALQVELYLRAQPDGPFQAEAEALLAALQGAAAPAQPSASASEQDLMERARVSGARADYQAYLDAYPDGVFAELAAFEIAMIDAAGGAAGAGGAEDMAALAPLPQPPAGVEAEGMVQFAAPLADGDPWVQGKTLEDLIAGSPRFPPIEGLPDIAWQGKHCTDCHSWNRDNLCTQGRTYASATAERSLAKQHPYGGSFKANLLRWARSDCK